MVAKTRKGKAKEAQKTAVEGDDLNLSPSQKLPVRGKDDESPRVSKVAKSSLTVFDDDDNAGPVKVKKAVVAKPEVVVQEPEEEEEESSDDEAPEAVSTAKVASDVKKTAQAAQKATQEKNAVQKRKRQERDALLKQQAEQRKQAEKEAAEEDEDDQEPASAEKPSWQKNLDRIQMPNLLPMEYLTDASSEDEDSDVDMDDEQGPKRRKVVNVERDLARLDKGPRDERVGSTVYRVSKQVDQRLAPKARKQSQNSRDLLMKRNRTPVQPRKGFFTKA